MKTKTECDKCLFSRTSEGEESPRYGLWYNWRCTKFQGDDGKDAYCRDVNNGNCRGFVAKESERRKHFKILEPLEDVCFSTIKLGEGKGYELIAVVGNKVLQGTFPTVEEARDFVKEAKGKTVEQNSTKSSD